MHSIVSSPFAALRLRGVTASAMIVLAFMPVRSGAQAPQPTGAPAQTFAAIDESLLQQADDALASTALRLTNGAPVSQENAVAPADEIPAAMPLPRAGRESTAAQQRVQQLRPVVAPILRAEGVPPELTAVILVESGGNPAALSPKGARGLWQLMPDTARRYGLQVDGERDERLDIEKSTRAAARYLSDLHVQFGSWPLVLAAYNTGEQNIERAIARSHSVEFSVLSASGRIPLETRNYVPAVMAAMKDRGLTSLFTQHGTGQRPAMVFALSAQ